MQLLEKLSRVVSCPRLVLGHPLVFELPADWKYFMLCALMGQLDVNRIQISSR